MSIGKLIRKILGKNFKYAGKIYRGVFINLELVYKSFPKMQEGEHLLDIGGGDGELINYILDGNLKVKITMTDISSSIGNSIKPVYKQFVNLLPDTSIIDYKNKFLRASLKTNTLLTQPPPSLLVEKEQKEFLEIPANNNKIDFVLISDVLHHIKPADRKQFFSDVFEITDSKAKIIIVDVEPGYFKTFLGYLSDRYISNDKTVKFISRNEVIKCIREIIPDIKYYETNLFSLNKPNYCLVFFR